MLTRGRWRTSDPEHQESWLPHSAHGRSEDEARGQDRTGELTAAWGSGLLEKLLEKLIANHPRFQPDWRMGAFWKTVRVFISSTFRDMQPLWDALLEEAFPRLHSFRDCEG